MYFDHGKLINAQKINDKLYKLSESSYTVSGNKIQTKDPDGQTHERMYTISGSSLTITFKDDFKVEAVKVSMPTVQDLKNAPNQPQNPNPPNQGGNQPNPGQNPHPSKPGTGSATPTPKPNPGNPGQNPNP